MNIEEKTERLLNEMSLEEKIGQLNQVYNGNRTDRGVRQKDFQKNSQKNYGQQK